MTSPPADGTPGSAPDRAPRPAARVTAAWARFAAAADRAAPALARIAAFAVVVYAALAGFRTMIDPDMWWQMSAGRYFVTSGHIARTEVFSYTAPGAPWTYPVGGGTLFYLLTRLGGFTLLSLLSPLVGAVIAFLLIRRGNATRMWMAALAVPVIALATLVRANMFTALLGTIFLTVLWKHLQGEEKRLWILPLLMLAWVNLHPGYIFGVALVFVFAVRQPRRVLPWALATFAATFVNPWGWGIYRWVPGVLSLLPLPHAVRSFGGHLQPETVNAFIGELSRQPISSIVIWQGLRDLDGFWWLMLIDAIAVVAGLFRKRFWGAFLLTAAAAAGLATHRLQGLFAITSVVLAPDLLPDNWRLPRLKAFAATLAAILLICFAATRGYNLATNHFYMTQGALDDFGSGASPWISENAVRFIEDHHLPRELYHEYATGGWVAWRMWPRYPVFIDGRLDPYGEGLFFVQLDLMARSPASPPWQEAIARWKIATVVMSTDRFIGYRLSIGDFCQSKDFRLVFLDDSDAVFVRESMLPPGTTALDCKTAPVIMPGPDAPRAKRYRALANSARLYNALGRREEAAKAVEQAIAWFDRDPSMHAEMALVWRARGNLAEAEREYRRAIELDPEANFWVLLGQFFAEQRRFDEAMECFRQGAARTAWPYQPWNAMAATAISAGRPADGLAAADRALATSPFRDNAARLGHGFLSQALLNRGVALVSLFRIPEAIESFESAIRLAPKGSLTEENLAVRLADAYYQGDRLDDARRSLDHANRLAAELDAQGDYSPLANAAQRKQLNAILEMHKK